MLETVKKGLNQRKAKVFVLFLLASSLIWFLSTLSQTYIAKTEFDLEYFNTNKNLRLTEKYTDHVNVKLQTGGFQFLGFNFKKKSVKLDLANVKKTQGRFYLPHEDYQNQIEKQLPNSMVLLEMATDTLYFDFIELTSKEIPVDKDIKLNLAHNFLLEGEVDIEPASITITGPKEEIDTINTVHTTAFEKTELMDDFSETIALFKSPNLNFTTYSANEVQIKGKVSKFSEKILDVPVKVINYPAGKQVRTFPDVVSVLCKAKIGLLKDINASDFTILADYSKRSNARSNSMNLNLTKQPKGIFSATLMETKVEFILNQE